MTATIGLAISDLTPWEFSPFGTVIGPTDDGAPFGANDAQLDLSNGTPRFYTMKLSAPGLDISRITRHNNVTQVLAAAGGHDWFLAAAAPGELVVGGELRHDRIHGFRIPGDVAVKLHTGTWHAGPLFEGVDASFFNLELADTNVTDHHSCELLRDHGVTLRLDPSIVVPVGA